MLNQIVVMGRLTRDPELRATQTGVPVASFSVACERDFAGRENGQRETDFIDCVTWRNQAEFVTKNFRKGDMIIVTGRLQIRDWTDKEGGKRRQAEIVAENIHWGETRQAKEARLNSTNNYGSGYGNQGYGSSGGYSSGQGSYSGGGSYGGQSGYSGQNSYSSSFAPPQPSEPPSYPAYQSPPEPPYSAPQPAPNPSVNNEPSFVELDDPELPF